MFTARSAAPWLAPRWSGMRTLLSLLAAAAILLAVAGPTLAVDPTQLDPGNAAEQWAGRSLGLPDASNARDLGGYPTTDGHWVRTGVAFRSGKLGGLSAAEWQQLRERGVNRVVDLRTGQEKSQDPDNAPSDFAYQQEDVEGLPPTSLPTLSQVTATLHCLAPGTPLGALSIAATLKSLEDVGTAEGYVLEACYGTSLTAFADTMRAMEDPSQTVILHCSAGKDRTGVGTAILLTILGVDRDTVLDDFEASNYYRGAGSVQRQWLQSWFQAVALDWGSFDNFVHHGLGLSDSDVAKLKARFLTGTDPLA